MTPFAYWPPCPTCGGNVDQARVHWNAAGKREQMILGPCLHDAPDEFPTWYAVELQ